jgi:hypothetical protein
MGIPPFGARQRLGKGVPASTNTRNNRRTVGPVVFCTVSVLSKESLWVCVSPIFARQQLGKDVPAATKIVVDAIFYAALVVSKEIR